MVDCSKFTSLAVEMIKDYVLYIRNYDQNRNSLRDKLEDLSKKKQDIRKQVKRGTDKTEQISKEAEGWFQKVRRLSQNEDLKKLVVKEYAIAEKAVKLMEEEDLKKLLIKKDNDEMQRVVVEVVEKHMVKEDGSEDYKMAAQVVSDVMKDISEDFKRLIKSDTKVAVAVTKLLELEELEKISQGDSELADTLKKAREICEENLWKTNDNNDSDVREMLEPLKKLTENEHFLKVLPENAKLGVQAVNSLIKGSDGLKNELAKIHLLEDGCYSFVVPFLHYQHRYTMSKAAEQLAKSISSLLEKPPSDPFTLPRPTADLQPIPSEFMKGLESREQLLRTILEKLQDDQVNQVGVFGMGGAGKTTLAKEVVCSRVKCNFDTIIMCEISENPNIKDIQDQIAEALDLPLHDVHSLSQRAIKLYNRLKLGKGEGKEKERKVRKTLIILDNMWQKLNLDEIGIPCESTNEFCCKFLLTSREKNVCQMMGVRDANIFQLGLLNESESRELFYYHVGKTSVEEDHYKSMAQRLLNKCGGLPLTIVATASAVKGKDLSMWRHFADELERPISSQVSGMQHETHAIILETSYNVMKSEEMKMFFLLACLSPLGSSSSIPVENLMRYGVGLDLFQHVNKLSEAMEQASTWTTELISSSMLLEGDSQGQVKIHDVVRASAISLAAKDKRRFLVEAIPRWMCKETFNKYMAISLLSSDNIARLNGVKARMLQILLLKGNLSSTSELGGSFFQGMVNLKVLDLSFMNLEPNLPSSIKGLKNLKTLHLEKCQLGDISLICELKKLLVLSLRDSDLKELPVEMGKLCNLRTLDMRGCKVSSLANTNVIASLSCLEGLNLFDNFKEWARTKVECNDIEGTIKRGSITEFHELCHLNLLEVNVDKTEDLPLGRFANNLDKFYIYVGEQSFEALQKRMRASDAVLWSLDTELNNALKDRVLWLLDTDLNNALKESSCLQALLKRADCLRLYGTTSKINLVPELDVEGFRDLKYLDLQSCRGLECVISTDGLNDSTPFQNLEYLRFNGIDDLKIICKGEAPPGMFSNIRNLKLELMKNLVYALPLTELPLNLTEIRIYYCLSLKFIFYDNDCAPSDGKEPREHKEKDVVIKLPRLKSVDITKANVLVSLFGAGQAAEFSTNNQDAGLVGQAFFNTKIMCPSLELLRLHDCEKIIYLWSKEFKMSSFQNLKKIEIKGCDNLQSLGSPSVFSALEQLESLWIRSCERMQEVITKETKDLEVPEKSVKFLQLRELVLQELSNLTSFYGGSYKVEFPNLKKLKLCHLPNLTTFVLSQDPTTLFGEKVELPYYDLEELKVIGVIKDSHTQLWTWHPSAVKDVPKLRKLKLDNIDGLRLIPSIVYENIASLHLNNSGQLDTNNFLFSTSESSGNQSLLSGINSSQLPKLEHLCVKSFPMLETLFEDEDNVTNGMSTFCKRLRHLELVELPELNLIPFQLFKNLRSLKIQKLEREYVFPSDLILGMLEDVEISECLNMDVVIQEEDGNVVFPRLKTLKLIWLSISSFSSRQDTTLCIPSLETLRILYCGNLETFWSGPLEAPKLKQVELEGCGGMQCFLSGDDSSQQVVELPSLQSVHIDSGDMMQSFSTIPLKAPNLREVKLQSCGEMEWFLPGIPNHDDVLELPSLETLDIYETYLQTFSPGPLEAPKLTQVTVAEEDCSIQQIHNLNDVLRDCYQKRMANKMELLAWIR